MRRHPKDGDILGEPKDGSLFRNKPVLARYAANDDVLLDLCAAEVTNFDGLLKLRKQKQDASDLENALQGPGYQLANVGVSALVVVNYRDENYLLFTKAERVDRSDQDFVAKLPSGYVPAHLMSDPERHQRTELAEELLPMLNGEILPGYTIDGRLGMPFESKIHYSFESYFLVRGNNFELPGMKRGKIVINDTYTLGTHAQFHAAADTNSGQIIFKYWTKLPNLERLSLHHSEDRFNPETRLLETRFHEEGILLVKLDSNMRLTDNVYTLANGELKQHSNSIKFTEALAPKQNGISSLGNISLKDYLVNQK